MGLKPNHFEGGQNISQGHRRGKDKILSELLNSAKNISIIGQSLIRHHPDGSDNDAVSSFEFDSVDKVWFNVVEPQSGGQDLEIHYKFTLPSFFTGFAKNAFSFQAKVDNSGGAATYQIIKIIDTAKVEQTVGLPVAGTSTSLETINILSTIDAISKGTYKPDGTVLVVFRASGNLNDKIQISNEAISLLK